MIKTGYSDEALMNSHYYNEEEHRKSLGQDDVTQYNPWRAHIYAVMEGGSYFGAQDWNDLLAYMDSEHKKILNLDAQVRQLNSMVRQYEIALRIKKEENVRTALGHNAVVEADSRGFMREVAPRTEG